MNRQPKFKSLVDEYVYCKRRFLYLLSVNGSGTEILYAYLSALGRRMTPGEYCEAIGIFCERRK